MSLERQTNRGKFLVKVKDAKQITINVSWMNCLNYLLFYNDRNTPISCSSSKIGSKLEQPTDLAIESFTRTKISFTTLQWTWSIGE